jgi:hypothetical protein
MNDFSRLFYIKDENVLLVVKMRSSHSPQTVSASASQTSRSCRDECTGRLKALRSSPWVTIYSGMLLEETSRDYRNEFIMTELLKLKPGSSCKD